MAATQYSKEKAVETMLKSLQSKIQDPVFGDLIIICGSKEWRVSKLIVSTQSEWFDTVCKSKFKEAEEATVPLPSDDPEAVNAMLSWCYNFDYDDSDSDGDNLVISRELLNVRVFALAEKYFIKPLQILAAEKFATAAEDNWTSPEFAFAVKEAYQATDDPDKKLRSAITAILVEHCKDILEKEKEYPEIHGVMAEVPEVATDAMKELMSKELGLSAGVMVVFKCPATLCAREISQVRYKGVRCDANTPRCGCGHNMYFNRIE